jgi:hypothetical protein
MTVEELIEELKNFPPKSKVETEGCDCIGQATKVVPLMDDSILICRKDGVWS